MTREITEQILTVTGECLSLEFNKQIDKAADQLKEMHSILSKRGYTDITWYTFQSWESTTEAIFSVTRKETTKEKEVRIKNAKQTKKFISEEKAERLEELKVEIAKLTEEIKASQQ